MEYWIFKLLLCINTLPRFINGDYKFECGEHGRFEYCIDGIPGCVIGCYCHPGYYFDAESKICEHNSKLTLQSRRMSLPEPITPLSSFTFATTKPINELDTVNKSGDDDLSDWLYNQFFKTIENQVINKTDDKLVATRRSGSEPKVTHTKAKRHKKNKSKKSKNKILRRKLLRITEDDSIFKSSSSSSSEESDSSESSGSSSESDSGSKEEKEPKNHKKLIMYQKRPKPPLPSFIFLPNGDTPFFPPIGLPAPAPLPMYPMVPIPPMVLVVQNKSSDSATTETTNKKTTQRHHTTAVHNAAGKTHHTQAHTSATKGTTDSSAKDSTTESEENEATTPSPNADTTQDDTRMKMYRKSPVNLLRKQQFANGPKKTAKIKNGSLSPSQRIRILQKLRQKYKNANPQNNYMDDSSPFQLKMPSGRLNTRRNIINDLIEELTNIEDQQNIPEPETQDVDFKYLTELIHDKNNVSKQFSRRSMGRLNENNINDTYYSSLGKEIASLIRKEEHAPNAAEQVNPKYFHQLQFYENSHSPSSYWERSVRSPFLSTNINSHKKDDDNLLELENRVEIVASTTPKLELEDLENIVTIMTKSRLLRHKGKKFKNYKNDNNNLKISLMPVNVKSFLDISMKNEITRRLNTILARNKYMKPNESENLLSELDYKKSEKVSDIDKQSDLLLYNPENIIESKNRYDNLRIKGKNQLEPKLTNSKYLIDSKNNNSQVVTNGSPKSLYLRSPMIMNHKNMKYVPPIREEHFKNFYSPYYRSFETSITSNFSPVHFFI